METKQKRVRCSEKRFLDAIYSSKTYAEISEKTGQKIPSTIARYARLKKSFSEKGVDLPEMKKKNRSIEDMNNKDDIIDAAKRLKNYYAN